MEARPSRGAEAGGPDVGAWRGPRPLVCGHVIVGTRPDAVTAPGQRRPNGLPTPETNDHMVRKWGRNTGADPVAVQAVCGELVSGAGAAIFLLNREKTGNFRKNSLIGRQICR